MSFKPGDQVKRRDIGGIYTVDRRFANGNISVHSKDGRHLTELPASYFKSVKRSRPTRRRTKKKSKR